MTEPLSSRRYGDCIYCGTQTTHGVADTKGVDLPVCLKCIALDDSAPEHDPDMEPGWKIGNLGNKGNQKYLSLGINIREIADRLGVSYISVYKRLLRAEQNGQGALAKLAQSLASDGKRVVCKPEVTRVIPVTIDRESFAVAYFTPKAAKVAKALEALTDTDKESIRKWFVLADAATVESTPPEAHSG